MCRNSEILLLAVVQAFGNHLQICSWRLLDASGDVVHQVQDRLRQLDIHPQRQQCRATQRQSLFSEMKRSRTPLDPKYWAMLRKKSQNVRHAAKDRNSYRGRLYPLPQGVPGQKPRTARFTRGPPSHCGCRMRIPNAMETNTCATNACRVLEFLHTAVFARGAALPNFRGSLARHPNIAGASQRGKRYGYALNAALEFE